ncbi:hypothetical protein L1887_54891 [Cichorium endivia]|nr:hypothetical protein L1887_54891 [Cichorium endivia]
MGYTSDPQICLSAASIASSGREHLAVRRSACHTQARRGAGTLESRKPIIPAYVAFKFGRSIPCDLEAHARALPLLEKRCWAEHCGRVSDLALCRSDTSSECTLGGTFETRKQSRTKWTQALRLWSAIRLHRSVRARIREVQRIHLASLSIDTIYVHAYISADASPARKVSDRACRDW